MIKNKKITYVLVTLLILSTLSYIGIKHEKAFGLSPKNGELTLKQAIIVGSKRAKEWDSNASLMSLTSVDENMGGTRGATGKRYKWTLDFIVPGTNKMLLVGVSEGKINAVRQVHGPSNADPIKLDDIKYDSPYLVKIAKEKYNLQKGEDWATGYQFSLDRVDGKPTVTVIGIDKDKLFTRISIDPKTSKVISAMHKVPNGGGLITLRLGTNEPKLIRKGMAIKGISANNNSLVTWGDQKPRVFNFNVQPFIEFSNNLGKTWTKLDFKKNITNAWLNFPDELYVATDSEIWRIDTSKNKMTRLLALNTKIEELDYSTNNNVAILSSGYIYETTDNGKHWVKSTQPYSIKSLQISEKGFLVILTNDGKVLQRDGGKWKSIKVPPNLGAPLDIKLMGDNLFLLTNSSLWAHQFNNNSWGKVHIKDDQISALVKKGHNLLGYSGNTWRKSIYLIKSGGEANEFTAEKLFDAKDRLVNDLEVTKDELLIATLPDYLWEQMN